MTELSSSLTRLVNQVVTLLGEVVQEKIGRKGFQRVERLRASMALLRSAGPDRSDLILRREIQSLRRLSQMERFEIAKAFTLMLETMNACENAYRSHEIRKRHLPRPSVQPESVIYVLTAHPTEARAPGNIEIFHDLLLRTTKVFARDEIELTLSEKESLRHALELAWIAPVVRRRKPRVQDEAEHIYSTLLRDETLRTLLQTSRELAPLYFRSWVGGDKDGHSGVDRTVFRDSLRLSRHKLIEFCRRRLDEVSQTLDLIRPKSTLTSNSIALDAGALAKRLLTQFQDCRELKNGDGGQLIKLRKKLETLMSAYKNEIGALHPSLVELKSCLHVFPALVVPLEFRESSDVLLSSPSGDGLAIYGMLEELEKISRGGDPQWYVRGLIVSMTGKFQHLQLAAHLVKRVFGELKLPIIPLFEQIEALANAQTIAGEMLGDRIFRSAIKKQWQNRLEIMLGYSDSSKESGVLKSRLVIAETMHQLDRFCTAKGVVPIFFQGSGGSTDRGGGTISEQTAWWSTSALRNYKVTIQGEMVERSLANPEITRGQIERITHAAGEWRIAKRRRWVQPVVLDHFADRVAGHYRSMLESPDFLPLIDHATPYPFLDLLKFGSRPSKRRRQVSLEGLRAIPWILCWTQTRVLFPTWWGVGLAWSETAEKDRRELLSLAKTHPLFSTYVRALGFTMAKVQMPIWRLYIEQSTLNEVQKKKLWSDFLTEFNRTLRFAKIALDSKHLIPSRPWLEQSIDLRSPMIHPLNCLQIIAMQGRDVELLRLTTAGIASGMMTTG